MISAGDLCRKQMNASTAATAAVIEADILSAGRIIEELLMAVARRFR
jgi:hypothetical protein